jgi:Fe-S cluster biogenesis protein NfuA
MDSDIRITAQPVDVHKCKFVVSEPVFGGVRRFGSAADAAGSPLAERLFAIPGGFVTEVLVSGESVTVTKASEAAWQAVGKAVGAAIRETLRGAVPAIAIAAPRAAGADGPGDDELYEQVADLFEREVNPMVARHGGFVELIDVQDAVVMLRMGGGCQGCGMASVTLRQGIEGILAQHVPAVKSVVDITDHGAGANPYFASSKK